MGMTRGIIDNTFGGDVLEYAQIIDICLSDKKRRERKHNRHVRAQNFAARHGYRIWNRIFNLINL